MNPWACGVAQARVLFEANHFGTQLVNGSGQLSAVVQLYHALREYEYITPWRLMDQMLEICAPQIYPGGRPTVGTFHVANAVSLGKDPALMKRAQLGREVPPSPSAPRPPPRMASTSVRLKRFVETGHGTGALPMDVRDASLLARLQDQKFKLDDTTIATLFPRSDDPASVSALSKKNSRSHPNAPTQKSSQFGKAHCNPFQLLNALAERSTAEQKDGALALDLFNIEMISIRLLRRWRKLSEPAFKEAFGDEWLEREFQLSTMVGYWFMALEVPDINDGRATTSCVERMKDGAVTAFEEIRGEVREAMDNGAKSTYLP